jgi:hypothetical protein
VIWRSSNAVNHYVSRKSLPSRNAASLNNSLTRDARQQSTVCDPRGDSQEAIPLMAQLRGAENSSLRVAWHSAAILSEKSVINPTFSQTHSLSARMSG